MIWLHTAVDTVNLPLADWEAVVVLVGAGAELVDGAGTVAELVDGTGRCRPAPCRPER